MQRLKKYIFSILAVGLFIVYVVFQKPSSSHPELSQTSTTSSDQSSQAQSQTSVKGLYTDGIFTGNSVDAYYGFIQTEVTIKEGKIADVKFLQYPNDRRESITISNRAMPILKSEAIVAQNAQVDVVSGATDTSEAFQKSLASALAQAK